MASAIASARTLRIAPRKMRLVADLIRGKRVAEARDILTFTRKSAAPLIKKVLDSAVANAENKAAEEGLRIDADEMRIVNIQVNEGITIKRFRPAPRGRALRVRKRTSHVELMIRD
jgi:large subunit ribosomal protein L22